MAQQYSADSVAVMRGRQIATCNPALPHDDDLATQTGYPNTSWGVRARAPCSWVPELLPGRPKRAPSQWENANVLLAGKRGESIAIFGDPRDIRGKWAGQRGVTQWMESAFAAIAAV